MLITFVKPIQVEAYRTDNSSWVTRMDAAYGVRSGDEYKIGEDGLVSFILYEGVSNQRDGTNSRFGLGLMVNDLTTILRDPLKRKERKELLDNWDNTPPEKKWTPLVARIRPDNIRGYTS